VLEQLTIRNLALLREVGFLPAPGLSVISGPTGGGKTLIVQALKLLRGEKAKAGLVRRGAEIATIDGVFRLAEGERSERIRDLCDEVLGCRPEDSTLVVTRTIEAGGRSRARVDGRPVAIRDLARFGAHLLEIHGQGSNKSLMRPETQTELLDSYAGLSGARHAFVETLREARKIRDLLVRASESEHERRERAEFLRYCLDEFQRVEPVPGERDELRTESRVLGNLDELRLILSRCLGRLHDGDDDEAPAIIESLAMLHQDLSRVSELDPRLEGPLRLVDDARVLLAEAVPELRAARENLDLDPERVQVVTERLEALERLLDRFGPSEAEMFASLQRMESELGALDDEGGSPEALANRLHEAVQQLDRAGRSLTSKRRAAAKRLGPIVERELDALGMGQARVEIRTVPPEGSLLDHATDLGPCDVEVFLAANPGEPLAPLRDTASGGEVARVMLVLKKILADADRVPVLVFDEADAEIGGRLGLAVGRKMRAVADSHQVLCITHLPQIAAFADRHFLVHKQTTGKGRERRTVSTVDLLAPDARQRELASMFRGEDRIDDSALREADKLLRMAGE